MPTNWSHYQRSIFEAIRDTSDSLIIEAVAGSGKTSTLVEAVKYVPAPQSVCFLAFNKRIAEELKKRVTTPNATCLTLHAAGWAAWRAHLAWDAGDCKVDQHKTRGILDDEAVFSRRERWEVGGHTTRLVGYAKQHGVVPGYCAQDPANSEYFGLVDDEDDTWDGLIEHYGLIREECNVDAARNILRESLRRSRAVVDYDDMLWLPVVGGVEFQRYDVVFVDEAQDVSGIQFEMIARMVGETGRVIACGDKFQSIYGFRGAMSDSMQLLAERFGCRPLPLSISYRCPKSVVLHAQQWVKHLEYADAKCFCGCDMSQYGKPHGFKGEPYTCLDCDCIGYREVYSGAVDGVVLGPMESAKDWREQAAMALGAPFPTMDHITDEDGITDSRPLEYDLQAAPWAQGIVCLCAHEAEQHDWNDQGIGRCQAEHCGCLSYVPQGGNDDDTMAAMAGLRASGTSDHTAQVGPPASMEVAAQAGTPRGDSAQGVGAPGETVLQEPRRLTYETTSDPNSNAATHPGTMGEAQRGSGQRDDRRGVPEGKTPGWNRSGVVDPQISEGVTKWLPTYESFAPGDAILCRVNRPLAALAFRLIRARVPCKLLGRDIGAGLVALVKRLANKPDMEGSIENLQERLEEYRQREGKRLLAKRDDAGLAALYDKLDTVAVFLEEAESVSELIREIEGMFGEDAGGGVVLCTVHKAKGLEWDRVFVLDAEEFMPGPWARKDWEREQEVNLQYVAATRAKKELRYIKSGELRRRSDG